MAQTSRRDPLVLVDTANLFREDWLAYRRQGTGGSTAILECKTTNYNARDKREYDGKPIVPVYYEVQGRHYMAVMDLNRVYYCCLYGNNEDEVIIRHIDRDADYESELIFLEQDFWMNNVQAQVEPPYIENDGELILESVRRLMGPSSKDIPPVLLTPPQSAKVSRFLELQSEKKRLGAEANRLKVEMDRLKALIVADMGSSCTAVYEDARSPYKFSDHLIRFVAVCYDLPQTDSIKTELEGAWTKGKYGCQLQVERWHEIVPPTIEGIRGYLSSGLLKGIGPKTADAIVQRFGIQSLYVLEHQPEKLLEIRGITEERLEEIKSGYAESKVMRDLMTLLAPFKVTPTTAMKIYEHFGPGGVELLRKS